jgi:hypothetical protein
VKGQVGSYVQRIHIDGHYVLLFKHPKHKLPMIKFSNSSIKMEVRVPVGTSKSERDAAEAMYRSAYGKSSPDNYVWHHHSWRRGVMQLVPEELHKITHVGRRLSW